MFAPNRVIGPDDSGEQRARIAREEWFQKEARRREEDRKEQAAAELQQRAYKTLGKLKGVHRKVTPVSQHAPGQVQSIITLYYSGGMLNNYGELTTKEKLNPAGYYIKEAAYLNGHGVRSYTYTLRHEMILGPPQANGIPFRFGKRAS